MVLEQNRAAHHVAHGQCPSDGRADLQVQILTLGAAARPTRRRLLPGAAPDPGRRPAAPVAPVRDGAGQRPPGPRARHFSSHRQRRGILAVAPLVTARTQQPVGGRPLPHGQARRAPGAAARPLQRLRLPDVAELVSIQIR